MHVLAIYELDLAYGGPEEGGWYYGTGERRRVLRSFASRDRAGAACARVNGWLDRLQVGVRKPSSSIYGGGYYRARVYTDDAPRHYPETRPHYE